MADRLGRESKKEKDIKNRLYKIAEKNNIQITNYENIVKFDILGSLKDVDRFEGDYLREFKNELEEYGDTEHYIYESLIEGVQEDDGWNEDEISGLDHYDVLNKIYNLTREIESTRRGVYTRTQTATELGQYIKDLAEDLDFFGDEIINLGDSEEIDESVKNPSRQPLKEATVISDIRTFRPWNKAVPIYTKIEEAKKLDDLEKMIEEMYPEGIEAQTLNDLLAYDVEFLEGMLGIDLMEEEK